MADFQIPTALDLKLVEQDLLPTLLAQRIWADFFPIRESDDSIIAWEQMDNFVGLQQLRGLNGAPPRVKRTGGKRFIAEPGVYGEFSVIDEVELTRRRQFGSLTQNIDARELVALEQMRLLMRRLDRIEYIIWQLVANGSFSVSAFNGAVVHTDAYNTQTFTASVPWATSATATPLADLRTVKLLARGHSVKFDQDAVAYMNSSTANRLYTNLNPADLYGRRTQGLGTYNSPAQISGLFTGDMLPRIVEYDDGYLDDTGTFQLYIPTGKVVLIGVRPNNVPVGEFQMTRNANNPGMAPGPYMKVVDQGENSVPRNIEVHDGFNGGPTLSFPSAIVVLNV